MRCASRLLLAAAALALLGAGCADDQRPVSVSNGQTDEIRASSDMFPQGMQVQVTATVK